MIKKSLKWRNNGLRRHIVVGKRIMLFMKNIEQTLGVLEDKVDFIRCRLVLDGVMDLLCIIFLSTESTSKIRFVDRLISEYYLKLTIFISKHIELIKSSVTFL